MTNDGRPAAVMVHDAALAREARETLLAAIGGEAPAARAVAGRRPVAGAPPGPLRHRGPAHAWPREGDADTPRVRLVRVSAHLHNALDEFTALGAALAEVLAQGE